MPSFTSNSEQNKTSGGWLRSLVIGFLIAFVVLGSWETFWRSTGFSPVIEDSLDIWAVKRRAVQKQNDSIVVLLGSSRMQLDVNPDIVQSQTGFKTLMLAIDGNSPLPVLEDLSNDKSFKGIILCSLLPQWLADGNSRKSRSAKWVRKFHKMKWSSWIEARLSLLLQSNFVFRYPGLLPEKLWKKFQEEEAPRPPYAPLRSDRYRPADYTKIDIARLRVARLKRQREIVTQAHPLTDKEFSKRISRIENMVHKIRERGGEVIFLRLPSCKKILRLEEETWPRRKYWDRFAATLNTRSLHFADYPELSAFDCPDGSHLGYLDAKLFTHSLLDVLNLR